MKKLTTPRLYIEPIKGANKKGQDVLVIFGKIKKVGHLRRNNQKKVKTSC